MWTVTGMLQPVRGGEHATRPCAGSRPPRSPGRWLSPRPRPSFTPVGMASFISPVSRHRPNSPVRTYRATLSVLAPMQGELPVVDRPGAVHGDVRDEPAFHQVDEVPLHAGPEDVRAHHQDAGARRAPSPPTAARPMTGSDGCVERRPGASSGRRTSRVRSCCRSASGWTRSCERSNCGKGIVFSEQPRHQAIVVRVVRHDQRPPRGR